MDSWLETLKSEGDAQMVDSGHFELSLEEAFRKLGAARSALPGFFILKAVQALVLSGAERIKVDLARARVQVQAELPEATLESEILAHMTASLLLGSTESAERHLAVALCSALAQPQARVSLSYQGRVLTYSDQNPQPRSSRSEEPGRGFLLRLERSPVHSGQWKSECTVVRERCSFAPIPIEVNGQEVHSFNWDGRHKHLLEVYWRGQASARNLVAVRWDGATDQRGNWLPGQEQEWNPVPNSSLTWLRQARGDESEANWTASSRTGQRSATPCTSLLAVRAEHATPAVGIVKWGVLLDLVPWRVNLAGAILIAACDQVVTDLSEMKPVQINSLPVSLREVLDCLMSFDHGQEALVRDWCNRQFGPLYKFAVGAQLASGLLTLSCSLWLVAATQFLSAGTQWNSVRWRAKRTLERFSHFAANPTSKTDEAHAHALQQQA